MGIKGLNEFLKKYYTPLNIPVKDFKGKKIAIDANNWLNIALYISNKKNVVNHNVSEGPPSAEITRKYLISGLIKFILSFTSNGITPIFVFDGKSPDKKNSTKEERIMERKKLEDKISEYEKLIINSSIEDYKNNALELSKLYSRCYPPAYLEVNNIKKVISDLGIPVIEAPGESEQMCSFLCKKKLVYAVYSTDTDNLVYGCPIIIKEFNGFSKDENDENVKFCTVVILKDVLQSLGITYDMFVDLCIMSGCDYNTRIPKVGPANSYKLLKQYGNIENIDKYETQCLDYKWCRQHFKSEDFSVDFYTSINPPQYELVNDIFNKYEVYINRDSYILSLKEVKEEKRKITIISRN